MGDSFNISQSNIGVLNTGVVQKMESISINISTLTESGHTDVATALQAITAAITESSELSTDHQAELLEQLDELGRQAVLPLEERSSSGVINAILSGIASGLGAAGGLAEVWSTWGETVTQFFSS